jgi:hypothetical protein
VQNSGNCKKGGCPEEHLGIKIGLNKFLEKHNFKYFKNLMVKVCKIWCNDVYMSIL